MLGKYNYCVCFYNNNRHSRNQSAFRAPSLRRLTKENGSFSLWQNLQISWKIKPTGDLSISLKTRR